jgi:hypothetical protein
MKCHAAWRISHEVSLRAHWPDERIQASWQDASKPEEDRKRPHHSTRADTEEAKANSGLLQQAFISMFVMIFTASPVVRLRD